MKENKLMEIERLRLISTDFGGDCKMLEFQFTNESYSYNSKSEDVECEITEPQAIELIGHLKSHFDINGWISVDDELPKVDNALPTATESATGDLPTLDE